MQLPAARHEEASICDLVDERMTEGEPPFVERTGLRDDKVEALERGKSSGEIQ
jgi:hypothetical protein